MKNVSIQGVGELIASLEKMGETLTEKDIQPILHEASMPIINAMKGYVAKKSGRVASKIKAMNPDTKKYPHSLFIGVDYKNDGKGTMTLAALSSVLEYGANIRKPKGKKKYKRVLIDGVWRTMSIDKPFMAIPARPFIRPAFDTTEKTAAKIIMDGINKTINDKATKLNLK